MGRRMTDPTHGPRAARRRERILDAARTLFARRGIEMCTVDDLVSEAGISRATFYRAFSGLDEVVADLYQEYEERVLADLSTALSTMPADGLGLDEVADRLLGEMRDRGPIVRAMFREELRPGSASAPMQGRRVQGQVAIISQWWTERTGLAPDEDLILSFILMLQSFGLIVAGQDVPQETFDRYRDAIRFVFRAVVDAYVRDRLGAG